MRNEWRVMAGLLCAWIWVAPVFGDDGDRSPKPAAAQRIGGDLFVGGSSVTVEQPVAGDLFAAGGSVDVDVDVGGDAVAMGGKLRLAMDVGQSVYAAGGQLNLNQRVGRNARLVGGQVELGPKSVVTGNLSVAGGQVRLHGSVQGHVQAAGGRVLIDGPVGGDVVATTGQLELGPNARIAGRLRYHSGDDLRQDPAAQVAGGIEKLRPQWSDDRADRRERSDAMRHVRSGGVGVLWTIGLIAMAAVLLAALPRFTADVARTLRERTAMSLLMGFVLLVCVPVATVVLMVTLIGIPLALAALALYLALLPLAYTGAAIGLGDWALLKWQPARAEMQRWRVTATGAALVLLALLAWIPWLGGFVALAVLLAGLGALMLQLQRRPGAAA